MTTNEDDMRVKDFVFQNIMSLVLIIQLTLDNPTLQNPVIRCGAGVIDVSFTTYIM